MKTLIFFVFALSATAFADDQAAMTFKGEIVRKAPLEIKFVPPAAHHFNLQAPASVELANGAAENQAGKLTKDEHKINVSFLKIAKMEKDCTVKASLYVCNDANTYCKPVKQNFACDTLAAK